MANSAQLLEGGVVVSSSRADTIRFVCSSKVLGLFEFWDAPTIEEFHASEAMVPAVDAREDWRAK